MFIIGQYYTVDALSFFKYAVVEFRRLIEIVILGIAVRYTTVVVRVTFVLFTAAEMLLSVL
jgi:hypothetical protein